MREVATKTGLCLRWEVKDQNWGQHPSYRLWLESDDDKPVHEKRSLGLCVSVHFDHYTKADLQAVRAQICDALLGSKPTGNDPVFIISIDSRQALRHSFPRFRTSDGAALAEFFQAIPLVKSLKVAFDFRKDAQCWYVALSPTGDWAECLAAIEEERSRPTLQEQFCLSDEAAKLLSWIEDLPRDKLLGSWTPLVEDARKKWIGIECPWQEENFPAYLQLLIDEINERTDYALTVQPWRDYGRIKSRIRIGKKQSEIDEVTKRVLWLAIKNGTSPDRDTVRRTIEELIRPHD